MNTAPVVKGKADGGAWALWEAIASGRPEFGNPGVFANHVDHSKWVSFTTTLSDPKLFNIVRDLTGNVPGEGGLITFPQSSWLASIVILTNRISSDNPKTSASCGATGSWSTSPATS